MRNFLYSLALPLSVLLFAACAVFTPARPEFSGGDRTRVMAAFSAFALAQKECPSTIDAGFVAEFDSFWRDRRAEGEVVVAAPGMMKLTAVDPLGRPLLILAVVDGRFTVVNIPLATVYTGPLSAAGVKAVFSRPPDDSFYLLTAHLPPGDIHILRVEPGPRPGLAIIRFATADAGDIREVVFDPDRRELISQAVLDRRGRLLFSLDYSRYQDPGCRIPTVIGVETPKGRLTLKLQGPVAVGPAPDFSLSWPPLFKLVEMK